MEEIRIRSSGKNIGQCSVCGKPYLSQRNTAKYCSENCKKKGKRTRKFRRIVEEIKLKLGNYA